MKVLAIDSSGLVASIAIVEDDLLIAEYTIQYKKTHSQTLLPMLDEVKKMIDLELTTLDAIVTAAGPGSFTGLRIGAATVKGLAGALNLPIIPVSTLEAMAYQVYGTNQLICPIMDARRGQVYTGIYKWDETGELRNVLEPCAIPIEELIESIKQLENDVIFLGDGTPIYDTRLLTEIKGKSTIAPAYCSRQRAAALGSLGISYAQKGISVAYDVYKPDYLRLSQAERERLEKENGSLNG